MAGERIKLFAPDERPDAGDFGDDEVSNVASIDGGPTGDDGANGVEFTGTGTGDPANDGTDGRTIFGGTGAGGSDLGDSDDNYSRNADGSFKYNKDGTRRRRRGAGKRPIGASPRAAPGPKASLSVGGLESLLYSVHMMGATMLKTPEIELTQGESQQMATAIANVAKHYPTTVIDPKIVDWGNLIMCLGMAYGPRVYMIRERVQQERQDKRAAQVRNGLPAPAQGQEFDVSSIVPGPKI